MGKKEAEKEAEQLCVMNAAVDHSFQQEDQDYLRDLMATAERSGFAEEILQNGRNALAALPKEKGREALAALPRLSKEEKLENELWRFKKSTSQEPETSLARTAQLEP